MARPELGTKRTCGECGARFYDLLRDPILCPKCGTKFVVAVTAATTAKAKPATAKAKPATAKAPAKEVVEEEAEDEPDEALVPLEDADAEETETGRTETDADDDADDDIPVVDDDATTLEDDDEDDSFLEDEEEDGDDVAVLIDGDIEDEEET